jgi:hypothetical protein
MLDDVYETIEFSDSSHIYTEPVKLTEEENEYGALRKINVKTTTTPKQTTPLTRKPSSSTKTTAGIKKSIRVRNLQKFPAMQDVSKVTSTDEEDEVEEKVELRVKSNRNSKRPSSKQVCTLVSVGLNNN